MRGTYRQHDAGPIVNLARHPRGTSFLGPGQFPKWQPDRWGSDGTYTLVTGITGHPEGITTAVRFTITTTTRSSHGFHLAGNPEAGPPSVDLGRMLPATPGERISVSCWLRYTGTSTQGYGLRFRPTNATGSVWIDNGQGQSSVPLPSGAWVRLSLTYTVPAGASFVAIYVTNNNSVQDAIGDTIDGTGLMVTRTPPPQGANIASDPYATKVTIPNNAWGWNSQWFGQGGTGTTTPIADANDGPDGIRTYLRKRWTTIGTNLSNVAFNHTGSVWPRVAPSDQVSVSSYFRASKGWAITQNCRIALQWYDPTFTQIGATIAGPQLAGPVVAGTWHKLAFTVTAPANAIAVNLWQDIWLPMGTWTLSDTIDGTGLVVTRTPPLSKFADGNSPGWRWLGAVDTSESVGYARPS